AVLPLHELVEADDEEGGEKGYGGHGRFSCFYCGVVVPLGCARVRPGESVNGLGWGRQNFRQLG
ncbi:hypothetical protein ACFVRU_55650, partial [Streptomyces sp. NPDC057927]